MLPVQLFCLLFHWSKNLQVEFFSLIFVFPSFLGAKSIFDENISANRDKKKGIQKQTGNEDVFRGREQHMARKNWINRSFQQLTAMKHTTNANRNKNRKKLNKISCRWAPPTTAEPSPKLSKGIQTKYIPCALNINVFDSTNWIQFSTYGILPFYFLSWNLRFLFRLWKFYFYFVIFVSFIPFSDFNCFQSTVFCM